jgi:hypothetical protein
VVVLVDGRSAVEDIGRAVLADSGGATADIGEAAVLADGGGAATDIGAAGMSYATLWKFRKFYLKIVKNTD